MLKKLVITQEEHGQAMVDYAVILAFVSISAVLILTNIGQKVVDFFVAVKFP